MRVGAVVADETFPKGMLTVSLLLLLAVPPFGDGNRTINTAKNMDIKIP